MTTLIERTSSQFATDCRIRFRQPVNRTLLVLPFETSPAVAERVLAIAAEAGNLLTAQQLIERATS